MSYNAAADLIDRHLPVRAAKTAYIDAEGAITYAALAERVNRAANAFRALGIAPGERIVLCMLDGVDLVVAFLGAIKAGCVPIPLNTLFPADDYAYILADSGAAAAIVSPSLLGVIQEAILSANWKGRLLVSEQGAPNTDSFRALLEQQSPEAKAEDLDREDPAFWLYSSGSTGRPKGAVHLHRSLLVTAEQYGVAVLGLREDDIVYSAAKLFFAYGLGNALTFPLTVGATTILNPERPTPDGVWTLLQRSQATVFFGVPTLFAGLLAHPNVPARGTLALRQCASAGEALPAEISRTWSERIGADIIDGIGSTEMLHIFVSNRPGAVRHGVTGKPVPGYEVRLVDEEGADARAGEIGEMLVRGASAASHYWNNPEKTAATFQDGWVRTGDKFQRDEHGDYIHCGRADDMLKISGIWVSPMEVEAALIAHPSVLEAAVIGVSDETNLVKTKAFIVTKPDHVGDEALARALQDFVKSRLAPYKYPRQIQFVDALPKTATGKIRRHVLCDEEHAMRYAAKTRVAPEHKQTRATSEPDREYDPDPAVIERNAIIRRWRSPAIALLALTLICVIVVFYANLHIGTK